MQFLQCLHFVMPNDQTIYNVLFFHHQVCYNVILNLMLVPQLIKVIKVRILWHHSAPFGSSSDHSSLVVRRATPAFLRCWILIAPTLVFHFQQDDHLTLFDAVAYVEIGIYPFQFALCNIHALLPTVIQSHVLPFESLVMQSYLRMQYSLMDQLHKQKFILLLIDVIQVQQ